MRKKFLLAVTAAALLVSACATLESRSATNAAGQNGNSFGTYNVPKARMIIEVYLASKGEGKTLTEGLIIGASEPYAVPGETVSLSAAFSPFSKDKYVIETDTGTQFLKSITINLEDKTSPALVEAAKSVGAIVSLNSGNLRPKILETKKETGGAGEAAKVYYQFIGSVAVDPTDSADVLRANQDLWKSVLAFADWTVVSQDCKQPANGCRFAKSLTADRAAAGSSSIQTLAVTRPFLIAPSAADKYSTCAELFATLKKHGVCLRASQSVSVTLAAYQGTTTTGDATIPAAANLGVFDVSRAMFATDSFSAQFQQGIPYKQERERTSQALTIASTPKSIIDAFISSASGVTEALSKLIQLRINLDTTEKGKAAEAPKGEKPADGAKESGNPPEAKEPAPKDPKDVTGADQKLTEPRSATQKIKPWIWACSYGFDVCNGALEPGQIDSLKGEPQAKDLTQTKKKPDEPQKAGDDKCLKDPTAKGCEPQGE